MTEERQSPDEIHRIMTEWWVQTNVGFLFRYWSTARAALEQVVTSPGSYAEFRGE